MTPDLVTPVVPNFALLSDVSYRVDLTDLDHDALPDPIGGFVESKESLTHVTDSTPYLGRRPDERLRRPEEPATYATDSPRS